MYFVKKIPTDGISHIICWDCPYIPFDCSKHWLFSLIQITLPDA